MQFNSRLPRLLPVGSKCSIDQYRMLQCCSQKKDCTEWNTWRKNNDADEIFFQVADMSGFFLEGVNFNNAHLESAVFQGAHCKSASFVFSQCISAIFSGADCRYTSFWFSQCDGAIFFEAKCIDAEFCGASCINACFSQAKCMKADFFGEANLTGADFTGAICTDANFTDANLDDAKFKSSDISGAIFTNAIVNQNSKFFNATIDDETFFLNSSISSMIIEPGARSKLEQNVRKESWKQWYRRKNFLACIPARTFWYISDYGYSTSRILVCFFIVACIFTTLYTSLPHILSDSSHTTCEPLIFRIFRMFTFSIATMVTLGFGNLNVANSPISYFGSLVVTLNLLTGYFLLAVLVTRLAVLFQTLGPGYTTPTKSSSNNKKWVMTSTEEILCTI